RLSDVYHRSSCIGHLPPSSRTLPPLLRLSVSQSLVRLSQFSSLVAQPHSMWSSDTTTLYLRRAPPCCCTFVSPSHLPYSAVIRHPPHLHPRRTPPYCRSFISPISPLVTNSNQCCTQSFNPKISEY